MSRPQNNLNLAPTIKVAYVFAKKPKKNTLKSDKIKSKNWRKHRKHMLFLLSWLGQLNPNWKPSNRCSSFIKEQASNLHNIAIILDVDQDLAYWMRFMASNFFDRLQGARILDLKDSNIISMFFLTQNFSK